MVRGLDPHSDFLDADAFKELQVSTQGKFGGLGIEVGVEDGVVRVTSPIEDTPAFRAGIKPGDLIVKLDDTQAGMPRSKAVDKCWQTASMVINVVRKASRRRSRHDDAREITARACARRDRAGYSTCASARTGRTGENWPRAEEFTPRATLRAGARREQRPGGLLNRPCVSRRYCQGCAVLIRTAVRRCGDRILASKDISRGARDYFKVCRASRRAVVV